jgi:hypothetical protein
LIFFFCYKNQYSPFKSLDLGYPKMFQSFNFF